jgi:glucose-1-phosphate adenylyltransferase
MRQVLAVILGGGKGTRLFPLTQYRSKPAVPLAGKYRLIDIPISNCINSGFNRIYLLTQFNSVSLHRHIRQTYRFDRFDGGFVEILAAQQTIEGENWYQGTADAVRKNLRYFQQDHVDQVLILSGDQLYRMNYRDLLDRHLATDADVTIAVLPCTRAEARSFGIVRLDDSGRVRGFLEKPQTDDEIDLVRTDPAWIDSHGLESKGRDCLASMGIYVFRRDVLVDLLEKTTYHDFGKEIFPMSIRTHKAQAYLFDGYWEDIGTVPSFFQANLDLTKPNPPFQFEDLSGPIFTHARTLPPTHCSGATIKRCLISDGVAIGEGCVLENSVIGLRCRLGNNVKLKNAVVMGADYLQTAQQRAEDAAAGRPCLGIGDGTQIEGAILDKNCRIGAGVKIISRNGLASEYPPVVIQDGIIVVPKDAIVPNGWSL